MDFSLPPCPIQRQENETESAYNALWVFLELGAIRNVQAVSDEFQNLRKKRKLSDRGADDGRTRNGWIERLAKNHQWHERASEYDDWLRKCELNMKMDSRKGTFEALVEPFTEGYKLKVDVEHRLLDQIKLNAISPKERAEHGYPEPFLSIKDVNELGGAFQKVTMAGRSIFEDALKFHGLDEIAKRIGAEMSKNTDKH